MTLCIILKNPNTAKWEEKQHNHLLFVKRQNLSDCMRMWVLKESGGTREDAKVSTGDDATRDQGQCFHLFLVDVVFT